VIQEGHADTQQAANGPDVLNDALTRMREHGSRSTTQRRLLLEALIARPGHRSAEQLATDVRARAPDVNITTIYRNLDELERLKIVDRTQLGHGPATYHLASAAHGHLVCHDCGCMTEVPGEIFTALARQARDDYGFAVEPHRSAVIGLCATCQNQ
jgi:Fur family transcriptional regulator, ferric uptake regulator